MHTDKKIAKYQHILNSHRRRILKVFKYDAGYLESTKAHFNLADSYLNALKLEDLPDLTKLQKLDCFIYAWSNSFNVSTQLFSEKLNFKDSTFQDLGDELVLKGEKMLWGGEPNPGLHSSYPPLGALFKEFEKLNINSRHKFTSLDHYRQQRAYEAEYAEHQDRKASLKRRGAFMLILSFIPVLSALTLFKTIPYLQKISDCDQVSFFTKLGLHAVWILAAFIPFMASGPINEVTKDKMEKFNKTELILKKYKKLTSTHADVKAALHADPAYKAKPKKVFLKEDHGNKRLLDREAYSRRTPTTRARFIGSLVPSYAKSTEIAKTLVTKYYPK